MNKIISQILQTKSWQELDTLISQKIEEEKKDFDNNSKGSYSYIAPPTDSYDYSINHIETFLHPEKTKIYISTGFPTYSYYFDDETQIYRTLANELSKLNNPNDISEVFSAVSETIFSYIGGAKVQGNDYSRMSLLKKESQLLDDEKNGISVFKGSKQAWCVERACIAHQLFKFLNLDSKIVMATITNNGEHQIHAFNLVKFNKKTYLFDSAVMPPPKENGKYNAVAMVLPEDVFDKNMVGIEPLPEREIVGASGRKYKLVYDLKNRALNKSGFQKE